MTLTFTDGTTTTDGTEQTVWDITADNHFGGWLFTHNMASGDIVEIRVYVKDQNSNNMRQYSLDTLSGAQTSPSYYLPFVATKEHKLTIKRTSGTDRAYTWQRLQAV